MLRNVPEDERWIWEDPKTIRALKQISQDFNDQYAIAKLLKEVQNDAS